MIILIDYHSGMLADAIVAEDHLALISIRDPGAPESVGTGWKHLLELQFADETRVDGTADGMTDEQADLVIDFSLRLGSLSDPVGLILRCDHRRRRSAAIAKALGEWCDRWFNNPGPYYSRPAYQTMRRRIGTRTPPDTVRFGSAILQRAAYESVH